MKNVNKGYRGREKNVEVLQHLSLELRAGESLSIQGFSGSGKSSLLAVIAGVDKHDSGYVEVLGRDFNSMSKGQISLLRGRQIGMVFQQFHLVSYLTALENVSLPLQMAKDPEATSKARHALDLVGVGHRAAHLPQELSGGECQRVALARSWVIRPALILADEPTGNLDPRNSTKIMDLLLAMVEQNASSLIIVTHNKSISDLCNRQVYLEGGQLRDRATPTATSSFSDLVIFSKT